MIDAVNRQGAGQTYTLCALTVYVHTANETIAHFKNITGDFRLSQIVEMISCVTRLSKCAVSLNRVVHSYCADALSLFHYLGYFSFAFSGRVCVFLLLPRQILLSMSLCERFIFPLL